MRTHDPRDARLARWFRLEHPANVFPLVHVMAYYGLLLVLLNGLGSGSPVRVVLVLVLCLLNYSLTIGIMHMHGHRPLFRSRRLNRAVEVLLCFPCIFTATEMKIYHVYYHHKGDNSPADPTSTIGYERGWRAIWYWLRFAYGCKGFVVRELFFSEHAERWRSLRRWFVVDVAVCAALCLLLLWSSPRDWLLLWLVPAVFTSVTTGYFAWLTHALAPAEPSGQSGSINTVNNLMNFFVHNQGYHSVHHRYPGIHWSEIPSKVDMLLDLDDGVIVPYWVTLNSAWRILRPDWFLDRRFGARWKARYLSIRASNQQRFFSYFLWI